MKGSSPLITCLLGSAALLAAMGGSVFLGIGLWKLRAIAGTSVAERQRTQETAFYQVLSLGSRHSCAIEKTQKIVCWGANDHGELRAPVAFAHPIAVAAADYFSCALNTDGLALCWGNLPKDMPPRQENIRNLDARGRNACFVDYSRRVRCWGTIAASTPTEPNQALQVVVGDSFACSLAPRTTCWGNIDLAGFQLPSVPPTKLVAGKERICMLDKQGKAICTGNASNTFASDLPGIRVIAVGSLHTCALSGENQVSCWGDSSLGQGAVAEISGRIFWMKAGDNHTCAVTNGGRVSCWGDNRWGQSTPPEELTLAYVD